MPINDIDELRIVAFGSRIFVQLEQDLWHERFFLGIGETEGPFNGTPDWDVYEASGTDCLCHKNICTVLCMLLGYDQINVLEIASVEILSRRLQLIEDKYAIKLREAEACGKPGTSTTLDERSRFLGLTEGLASALVCPALEQFVADRLREESQVLKERRKGREERALIR